MGEANRLSILAAEMSERCKALKAELQPGDYVVYESPTKMTDSAIQQAGKALQRAFPHHKVMVLDGGARISAFSIPEPQIVALQTMTQQTKDMLTELQRMIDAARQVV